MMTGMQMLEKLKESAPRVPVIMLTSFGDIPSAVQAMRLGAYHYLTKPFQNEDLVATVQRALDQVMRWRESEDLRHQLAAGTSLQDLMGPSAAVRELASQVEQVGRSTLAVVIQGETGTGKEVVARAIHRTSVRSDKPFIALDCGAIPDTLIESELFGYERGAFTGAQRRYEGQLRLADQGTLLLDEIGNLSVPTQAKLLRTFQEKIVTPLGGLRSIPVDVRVLASSNLCLEEETREGRFRQDLYYRLAEYTITLPPLRARPDDILFLANRFLLEMRTELDQPVEGIAPDAAQLLRGYRWPGNVRELKNVIRRAAVMSAGPIRPAHLDLRTLDGVPALAPDEGTPGALEGSLSEIRAMAAAAAERGAITRALQTAKGNKSQAARLLKTDFKTLHLKMKRYGISGHEAPEE
jgi:two-component system nitrogen regulation response regulator GlnG